jgi:hypothetical protein
MLEECGTVKWAEALVSGVLIDEAASEEERVLVSLGSFGVGLKRSGCAICASRVSYGKKWALGSPAQTIRLCLKVYGWNLDLPPAKFPIPGIWKYL